MTKQIKPNSLSHKFLSLIFEDYEIQHGINICDVPWRALKMLVMTVVSTVAILMFVGMVVGYAVGVVLALLSPFFQYNYFFATLAGLSLVSSVAGAALYFIISIVECSHGNIPLLPSYVKKATPKEPSPPSVLSLWWTSFKEKTCFKIVVGEEK